MNIYYVTRATDSDEYDVYNNFVVIAPDADSARKIHPNGVAKANIELDRWKSDGITYLHGDEDYSWVSPRDLASLKVTYLGIADAIFTETEVICSSFRAG